MTNTQETALLALSTDTTYQVAIQNLYQQPCAFITANLASVGSGGSAPAGFLELADALATLIENSQPLTTARDRLRHAGPYALT